MKNEKYKVPLQKRHTVSWNVSMQHKLQLLSDGFKFTPIISNEMFNEKFEPKQQQNISVIILPIPILILSAEILKISVLVFSWYYHQLCNESHELQKQYHKKNLTSDIDTDTTIYMYIYIYFFFFDDRNSITFTKTSRNISPTACKIQ